MMLLIVQLSPASCHFSLLGPDILPSALFSNTLSVYSSNVRDPHPYKTPNYQWIEGQKKDTSVSISSTTSYKIKDL
jgi:hypothetical protein